MKKIAIVGFGVHVQKNILPAITRSREISVANIYVRDVGKYECTARDFDVQLKPITESIGDNVDAVYISTPIATHYQLAKRYLEDGNNVICEKPLTECLKKTDELFAIAHKNNVQLHEVCMYQHHKQFRHLESSVNADIKLLRSVSVKFSIPHTDPSGARYQKQLGGGALLDVGYYPISLIISLFGKPGKIKRGVFSQAGYEVDLAGYAVFEYENFYCVAEWGIGIPYANEVSFVFENTTLTYPRIFSKPETLEAEVKISSSIKNEIVSIGCDDHFVNMFSCFLNSSVCTFAEASAKDIVDVIECLYKR